MKEYSFSDKAITVNGIDITCFDEREDAVSLERAADYDLSAFINAGLSGATHGELIDGTVER